MKKSKTKEVDAGAARGIVSSATSKFPKVSKGFVSRVLGDVIKRLGLDGYVGISDYFKEGMESAVNRCLKATSDIDYYLWRERQHVLCDGLYGTTHECADSASIDAVKKAARVTLDSIRTKRNGIEMWYRVETKEKFGTDPETRKDAIIGKYQECDITISSNATHLQKLKAASVFIKNMEKLCGRSVFLVGAEVTDAGLFRITVDFRVGYPATEKKPKLRNRKQKK